MLSDDRLCLHQNHIHPLDGFWSFVNVLTKFSLLIVSTRNVKSSIKMRPPRQTFPGIGEMCYGSEDTVCERQLGERCNCMVIKHTPSGIGLMIRCLIIPVVRRYDVQALDVILLANANGLTWNTSQDMDNRPYPPFLLHDSNLRSRGHRKYLFLGTTSTVPVISSPPVVWRNIAWRCLRYSWRRRRS